MMVEGLVDKRNSKLLEELQIDYSIELELVTNTNEYGCYSIDNKSIIYVPVSNIRSDSFTHELLHIYLRSKGIFIGARLKRKLQRFPKLSLIFTDQLLEHIGNCLDHIKILPIYLGLGYDRSRFIYDYHKNKLTNKEIELLKEHRKKGQFELAQVIEFYLEKFYAAKACPNDQIDYSQNLQELKALEEELYLINEKLINRWSAMKIDRQDDSEDDYITIAEDYIGDMKEWVKSKNISNNLFQ